MDEFVFATGKNKLATGKNKLQSNLCLLKQCINDIGMIIHPTKSQYMTINCNDELPFYVDNVVIEKTNTYVYLGALITNQVLSPQVKEHATMKGWSCDLVLVISTEKIRCSFLCEKNGLE